MTKESKFSLAEIWVVFAMFAMMVTAVWQVMCYMKDILQEDIAVISIQITKVEGKVEILSENFQNYKDEQRVNFCDEQSKDKSYAKKEEN